MSQRSIIQIFRAGRHVPVSGVPIEMDDEDLERTASAYNRSIKRNAPLVLGHPADDRPAYGVVHRLMAAAGALFAEVEADSDLRHMVRAGQYKKISAAFFRPESRANPSPGVFYLKHVGFLGAMTPAVKGMIDPAFADGGEALAFAEGIAAGPMKIDLDRPAINQIEAIRRASGNVLSFDQAARALGL